MYQFVSNPQAGAQAFSRPEGVKYLSTMWESQTRKRALRHLAQSVVLEHEGETRRLKPASGRSGI